MPVTMTLSASAASASASAVLNPYSPVCSLSPCLQQVIGQVDGNPLGQYASCTSLFGLPQVSTVTASADTVFSTSTSTFSYTDIVVSLTTTTSTAAETVTSYVDVVETATVYTTTIASTTTATTVAPTFALVKKDGGQSPAKRMRRRRACGGGKPSSTAVSSSSSSPSSSAASSLIPSSTVAPSSSSPVSSSTAPPPQETDKCPTLEEYSSACNCIGAASGVVSTVTEQPASPTITSIVHSTETVTVPSVSESVITVVETTVIVQPTTQVTITTLLTAQTTIATVTTTTTPVAPTQTATLVFASGPYTGKALTVVSNYVQWTSTGTGQKVAVTLDRPSSPWLPANPTVTLWLHSSNSVVGVLYFQTAAMAGAYGDPAVTCSVNAATGVLSCASSTGQHTEFLQCGAYVYLAAPSFSQSGCNKVSVKLSGWLAA